MLRWIARIARSWFCTPKSAVSGKAAKLGRQHDGRVRHRRRGQAPRVCRLDELTQLRLTGFAVLDDDDALLRLTLCDLRQLLQHAVGAVAKQLH